MKNLVRIAMIMVAALPPGHALASESVVHKAAGKDTAPAQQAPKSGFVPIPAFYYTPETELAAGGLLIYYFRNEDDPVDAKPSQIKPLVITTEKKQLITSFLVSRRWNQGRDHASVFTRYRRYPDKIWATGPDSRKQTEEQYSADLVSIDALWERDTGTGWSAGPVVNFSGYDITSKEDQGILADSDLAGRDRSRTAGVGVTLSRDTRDNLFAASSGAMDGLRLVRFNSFTDFQLDARRYVNLAGGQVVAARLSARLQEGEVPFRELASLGGPEQMRGFYEGRFRDKTALTSEVEYRFPLWWNFRGAAFASTGNVGGNFVSLFNSEFKSAWGGGVRFVVDQDERIAIRVDYGKTSESEGFYVQLNEAF